MPAISPRIASDIASKAYDIKGPVAKEIKLDLTAETQQHFSFNLSKHIYKGTSGGFFGDRKPVSR